MSPLASKNHEFFRKTFETIAFPPSVVGFVVVYLIYHLFVTYIKKKWRFNVTKHNNLRRCVLIFRNNLYSLNENVESDFLKGQLIKVSDYHPDSYHLSGLKDWITFLGLESIEIGVTTVETKEGERLTDFKHSGIAYEFSKLKTNNDIHEFASKYGLLGIKTPTTKQAETQQKLRELYKNDEAMLRIFNTAFLELTAGNSFFEPLEVWTYYVEQVRKILKLYKTLVSIHYGTEKDEEDEIESKLLNIGDELKSKSGVSYVVEWWDGTPTGLVSPEETAMKGDFIEIARNVLIHAVNHKTSQHINNFALNIIETNKPPLGFVVQETRTTSFLLNAIYYDLWDLIAKNEPVHICENSNCKLPFKKQKRQKYCSNACKQEAYRIRIREALTE